MELVRQGVKPVAALMQAASELLVPADVLANFTEAQDRLWELEVENGLTPIPARPFWTPSALAWLRKRMERVKRRMERAKEDEQWWQRGDPPPV
jgi:hypothetical protein